MKTSDKAFGEKYSEKFEIGELVWWISWEQDEGYQIHSVVCRGVLIQLVKEKGSYTGREISMAIVLPFGSQHTIRINSTLLRKDTI